MDDYVSVDQEVTDDAIVVSVKFSSELAECEDVDSEEPHPLVTAKEAQVAVRSRFQSRTISLVPWSLL